MSNIFSYAADGSRREGTWQEGDLDGIVFLYKEDKLIRAERWFRGTKVSDKEEGVTTSTTTTTAEPPQRSKSFLLFAFVATF